MKSGLQKISVLSFGLILLGSSPQAEARVSLYQFYRELAPYGHWFEHPDYGQVWQPAGISRNWRPYTDGYWLNTEQYGWYWQSDWTWGWAAFHYGRWTYEPFAGWIWIPDTVWAPAWVAWQYNTDFSAWAALPPKTQQPPQTELSASFNSIPSNHWVVVPPQQLTQRHLMQMVLPTVQNKYYINQLNNSYNALTLEQNRIVNTGMPVVQLEWEQHLKVQTIPAHETELMIARQGNPDNIITVNVPASKANRQVEPKQVYAPTPNTLKAPQPQYQPYPQPQQSYVMPPPNDYSDMPTNNWAGENPPTYPAYYPVNAPTVLIIPSLLIRFNQPNPSNTSTMPHEQHGHPMHLENEQEGTKQPHFDAQQQAERQRESELQQKLAEEHHHQSALQQQVEQQQQAERQKQAELQQQQQAAEQQHQAALLQQQMEQQQQAERQKQAEIQQQLVAEQQHQATLLQQQMEQQQQAERQKQADLQQQQQAAEQQHQAALLQQQLEQQQQAERQKQAEIQQQLVAEQQHQATLLQQQMEQQQQAERQKQADLQQQLVAEQQHQATLLQQQMEQQQQAQQPRNPQRPQHPDGDKLHLLKEPAGHP